jgi:YD repeat-containing protein
MQSWTIGGTLPADTPSQAPDTFYRNGAMRTQYQPAVNGLPAETLTYGYKATGEPNSLIGANTYVSQQDFNLNGQLITRITGGGFNKNYGYDTLHRIVTASATPYTNLQNQTFNYNAADQLTRVNDNTASAQEVRCNAHDAHWRLVWSYTGTSDCSNYAASPMGTYNRTWTYSDDGNLTSQTDANGPRPSVRCGLARRLRCGHRSDEAARTDRHDR